MDPRLPTETAHPRTVLDEAPVPPPRPHQSSTATAPEIPVAYNDKVVAFLRQPNIIDILKERHSGLGQNIALREKINMIRAEGTAALQRLGHDVPLALLLRYIFKSCAISQRFEIVIAKQLRLKYITII